MPTQFASENSARLAVPRLVSVLFLCSLVLAACSHREDSAAPDSPTVQQQAAACHEQMQVKFKEQEDAQTAWYQAHTSTLPDPSQRTKLEIGTNGKAVMVIHGFISSPAYMQEIAQPLVQQGYTVLSPLLTGYGTDATAANSGTADDWRHAIETNMTLLKMCYPEVAVVAHSLGAALVTDEIQNRNFGPVSKLVLLAPYFKANGSWPSLLSTVLSSRVDSIDVDLFRRVTGGLDPYEYLPINRPLPGAPEPYLPIPALGRVLDLQSGFSTPAAKKLESPALVVLSESDNVVDSGFANQYVLGNFSAPTTLMFEKASSVSHSMQLRANNPRFNEMLARIEEHLK